MINRQELKEKYQGEEVLVVPLEVLQDLGVSEEGYHREDESTAIEILIQESYLIPRYLSDYNPEEVEIIPYVTIRDEAGNLLTYKRIKNGDKRGDGMYSIGIGGHANSKEIYEECYRELVEEIGGIFEHSDISHKSLLDFKGIIRCVASDFDKDHVGIHFEIQLSEIDTIGEMAEEDKMLFLGMISEGALKTEFYDRLENWSKMLLK